MSTISISTMQPLILWGGVGGPNPTKVAIILNELGVAWTPKYIPFSEIKGTSYVKVNPNERLPSLEDPNYDITIWESGAIIEYVIEKYDPDHKISFEAGTKEYYYSKQWLHFQMSGQGPYYGQAYWFLNSHPEKIQVAIDRYLNEIRRVSKVLNNCLEGKKYLVGGKCTYADLAFIMWQSTGADMIGDHATEFPNVQAWLDRMKARPAVMKVMADKAELMAKMKKDSEGAAKH